jgi:hypothetical protein
MVIFRPTLGLAVKMRIKTAATNQQSDTRLGDWYAKDVILGKRRLVLCVSDLSRLAVVLDAAPYASIPERLPPAVGALLERIGPPREAIEREVAAMRTISIAKTNSRSVLGSLNEYEWMLRCRCESELHAGPADLLMLSLWLSDTVTSALPDLSPGVAAMRLLSGQNE